ncbi:MAG: hypothetical protein M3X11_24165, partial [Acidobacteriota bacterium]|nr:hypothetical protein [Acidobacteriota bacterium]
MKQFLISALLAAFVTLNVAAQAPSQPLPSSTSNAPNGPNAKSSQGDEFFPVEKVKPGMRAIGYTVFNGSEPKKFELEILGVLTGFPNPQQNAVLSRLLGDELQHTGVFQGMSGSPVYIDGKLLGAVAFGYQFAKDPIAGITPIGDMIKVFEQKQNGDKPTDKNASQPRPVSFSEISFNENSLDFKEFVAGLNGSAKTGVQAVSSVPNGQVLMPIATPLAITGVAPDVVARFAPMLQ